MTPTHFLAGNSIIGIVRNWLPEKKSVVGMLREQLAVGLVGLEVSHMTAVVTVATVEGLPKALLWLPELCNFAPEMAKHHQTRQYLVCSN